MYKDIGVDYHVSGKLGNFQSTDDSRITVEKEERTFIEQRVENLKREAISLDVKIANVNMQENFGTYKNLIQAYTEILRLIERYDWQLKYSEYRIDEDKQVAVWEQNGEGNIRNHKVWNVNKEVKKDMYIEAYRERCAVYFDGKIYYIQINKGTSLKSVTDVICEIVDISKYNIYINTLGIGQLIADELDNKQIEYYELKKYLPHK